MVAMRLVSLLSVVSVAMLVGCSSTADTAPEPVNELRSAAPVEVRDLSVPGDQGLSCVDAVDDVEAVAADLEQVDLSFEPDWIVLTYSFRSITSYQNTAAVPVVSVRNIPELLQLDTTLRPVGAGDGYVALYANFNGNSFNLSSFTPVNGRFDVQGQLEVVGPMKIKVKFPASLLGSLPSQFEWTSGVVYDRNKKDPCVSSDAWLVGSR